MATGATSTYGITVGIKLDVEDLIQFLSPKDTPLLNGDGGDATAKLPSSNDVQNKKYEWLDETLLTPRTTIQTGTTTGDSYVVVASGDKFKFQTGDLILVGSEYMRITDYGSTADSLVVTRAISGSAATVAANAAVIGVGSLLPEGSAPPAQRYLERTNRYNYTEIFGPYKIESTNSDLAVAKYGVANEHDHQAANRVAEAAVAIEQALIYGVRLEDAGNNWRSMAGILSHITTTIDSTTTTFSEASELAQLQAIYELGGAPDILMVGPKNKRLVSAWTSAGTIQVARADNVRGSVVSVFDSDFGTMRVVLNRWLRTADAVNFSREQAEILTLRELAYTPLAVTGDSMSAMIVGEKGFKFYRQAHAGKFSALT